MSNNRKRRRREPPSTVSSFASDGNVLSQFITVHPKPSLLPPPSSDELLKRYAAPLPAEEPTADNSGGVAYFYFACEIDQHHDGKDIKPVTWRRRTADAGRSWHEIKVELEKRLQLRDPRQQKRGLSFASLLAYRWSDWKNTCGKRQRLLIPTAATATPLSAKETIRKDDQIVLMRLPERIVSRLYHNADTLLEFSATETEAERIARVTGHNYFQPRDRDSFGGGGSGGPPPPSYRCHNCGQPGHWRNSCKMGRRMAPKGIPKRFLKPVTTTDEKQSTYVLEDGTTVQANFPTTAELQ